MTKSVSTCFRRQSVRSATFSLVFAAAAAVGFLAVSATASPALAENSGKNMRIAVDEAQVLKLNRVPGTVILGNPLIADVAVHNDGLIVIVGKTYGTTNLIALDEEGEELTNVNLSVRTSGANAVSMYRGTSRHSMNCSPRCEYELDVGDDFAHFKGVFESIENKLSLSQSQSSGR